MRYSPKQRKYIHKLRSDQTDAEKLLWSKLRGKQVLGVKFRRQQPLEGYILDFVSFDEKIVIELDGGQHNELEAIAQDNIRTKFLENNGYRVLRFWNNEALTQIDSVVEKIRSLISPSP